MTEEFNLKDLGQLVLKISNENNAKFLELLGEEKKQQKNHQAIVRAFSVLLQRSLLSEPEKWNFTYADAHRKRISYNVSYCDLFYRTDEDSLFAISAESKNDPVSRKINAYTLNCFLLKVRSPHNIIPPKKIIRKADFHLRKLGPTKNPFNCFRSFQSCSKNAFSVDLGDQEYNSLKDIISTIVDTSKNKEESSQLVKIFELFTERPEVNIESLSIEELLTHSSEVIRKLVLKIWNNGCQYALVDSTPKTLETDLPEKNKAPLSNSDFIKKREEIFNYIHSFAKKNEKQGKGTRWPKLRVISKKFKCSVEDIEEMVDSYDGPGYVGFIVAEGINGGYYEFDKNEREIEVCL